MRLGPSSPLPLDPDLRLCARSADPLRDAHTTLLGGFRPTQRSLLESSIAVQYGESEDSSTVQTVGAFPEGAGLGMQSVVRMALRLRRSERRRNSMLSPARDKRFLWIMRNPRSAVWPAAPSKRSIGVERTGVS